MKKASLWSDARLSPGKGKGEESRDGERSHRTTFEQDYDRILFSTPVRRLSDKTQVFPLDTNDGVRTRLTHSHEVANLARSIGARISRRNANAFDKQDPATVILPILGAIGLAHDLGNPPFGHQGEAAIAKWFSDRKHWIFDRASETETKAQVDPVRSNLIREFTEFDGNPQTIRLLTRLQTSFGKVGLDLTAATIAAAIKYPVPAQDVDPKNPIAKKYGYFASEEDIVAWAWEKTGLKKGQRHPLTWIMEAADDIAYSILDVEDAMKKGIISPNDLMNILRGDRDGVHVGLCDEIAKDFDKVERSGRLPAIVKDMKIGYARSHLIANLIEHAASEYLRLEINISDYSCRTPLMDSSKLCESLKDIAREYAFGNPEVLFVEAKGRKAIEGLLGHFWHAIYVRRDKSKIMSRRNEAFSRFVFSLFSSNYLEAAVDIDQAGANEIAQRLRYRELRLLTDMISGMTDGFALNLSDRIEQTK